MQCRTSDCPHTKQLRLPSGKPQHDTFCWLDTFWKMNLWGPSRPTGLTVCNVRVSESAMPNA